MALGDYLGNVPVPSELPEHPPGSWVDVEPPTEPNAAPGLDPVLLAGVEREAGIALRNTMEGRHHVAAAHGRRALDLLLLAHAKNERRAMFEQLAESVLPAEAL